MKKYHWEWCTTLSLVVLVESLRHLSERLDSFWRMRRLELKADYVVEASVRTIILFCVKSAKMLIDDNASIFSNWTSIRSTSGCAYRRHKDHTCVAMMAIMPDIDESLNLWSVGRMDIFGQGLPNGTLWVIHQVSRWQCFRLHHFEYRSDSCYTCTWHSPIQCLIITVQNITMKKDQF